MHRIHYAGDSILTGSSIAVALLDYAQALAEAGSSATVEVPTISEDGTPGRSDVLIGPASQLIADAEESTYEEVEDQPLVDHMTEQAHRLRRHGSSTLTASTDQRDDPAGWADYDL